MLGYCFWVREERSSKLWLYEPLAKAPFKVCAVPDTKLAGKRSFWLQQAQLAGTGVGTAYGYDGGAGHVIVQNLCRHASAKGPESEHMLTHGLE